MVPCAILVLASVAAAIYVILRYEGPRHVATGDENERRCPGVVRDEEVWLPCFRNVHPVWLMSYRLMCLILFSALTVLDISHHHSLLYFYTECTFLLVTVYFGLATGMSIYGCRKFEPEKNLSLDGQGGTKDIAGFWGYLLQVIYQTAAGAVMLTDFVYWVIIFPNIIKKYDITFWNVMPHSFNVIFLLGDAALNSMCFPSFRIGYFVLYTASYVMFQWIVHALSVINWWPYPFLDWSANLAPLWYIVVGLLQLPSYFAFTLAMILKRRIFSKWFPATFIQA